jgi:uncharacterized iron-regulated membrane protein
MITGPLVFVIALTGCLYAFQEEIQNYTQPYRFYKKGPGPILAPSILKEKANNALPGKQLHAYQYFTDIKAAQFIYYAPNQYYKVVYINPQKGEILKVANLEKGFFPFILKGHFYLWLPPEIGQPIVASTTLIFTVVIISGLVLWWPKKRIKRDKFSIKWKARWKRLNYDLHSVLGFYVLIFALVFAITGLVWGFEWFRNSYYSCFSGGKQWVNYEEPKSIHVSDSLSQQVDKVFYKLYRENPKSYAIEVHFPETKYGSIAANINYKKGTYWKTDYFYFDQGSLKDIKVKHYWSKLKNANSADMLMRMNYDIHTGAIWGLPGKILAFSLSLIIASLPITGFLFYLGRKRKKT